MSHVKNAVSYSRLVDICTRYGGSYNPGHQTLQLKAMRALLKEAQSSLQDVSLKQDVYHRVLNERGSAFEGLHLLTTRIIGTLETLSVSQATIDDARYYGRLVYGRRATPRLPVPSEEGQAKEALTRKFGQKSYVARASNFFKLVQMVQELPAYVSNLPELQVPALMEKAATLQQLNEEVYKAKSALYAARLNSNRILYHDHSGMVDNARDVKRYIRVVFGTRSGEAAELKEVRFTKPKVR